jgi:hypothetical protein
MTFLTILLAFDFVVALTGTPREVVPAMALLRSLVHLFASFCLRTFTQTANPSQPSAAQPIQQLSKSF